MGAQSKIEWTDATWNPVTGCTPISTGCAHCYARRMAKRLAGRCGYPAAPHEFDVTLHPEKLDEPLHWKKPRRIFVCSMSDLFHEDVSFGFIDLVWVKMSEAKRHTYQILTKRPERMLEYMQYRYEHFAAYRKEFIDVPNLCLGVTAEDQEQADKRIPVLLQIPAAVRFVSVEPMLGPVDISLFPTGKKLPVSVSSPTGWDWCGKCGYWGGRTNIYRSRCPHCGVMNWESRPDRKIDWVIVGGETGPGARPMRLAWVRAMRDQCQDANVPFFFKSWGDWVPASSEFSYRVGKKQAGRLLDGVEWDEVPGAD